MKLVLVVVTLPAESAEIALFKLAPWDAGKIQEMQTTATETASWRN